ncbi:discoidin domain-containing protein [Novosphingobium sp. ZN18A2]|uniref:discoidin domain-containing protein n=1 Tax=Novosphingobium sp. ZN18A2 TaxID=3079861 RepID=UPI0030D1B21E
MRGILRTLLTGSALVFTSAAGFPRPASPPPAIDEHAVARRQFGNDAPWYEHRIPFFESSDSRIDAVYYYRWSIFRSHQRDLGDKGYITTEFANDVSWQREPYASLNDASGFHIAEGRWLNDRRFTDDYINYMYRGGNDRHFTDYMAASVWGRYLVDGDRAAAVRHLPVMRHIYGLWDDHYDFGKGLYFIEPLLDATEYTVSSIDASGGKDGFRGGDSFRPSINSYMFANARAISNIARLAGDGSLSRKFAGRAEDLRKRVVSDLWNQPLTHFTDRYKVGNEHVAYWQPVRARELVGYLPWTFDLAPDSARYATAWSHLLDPASLAGAHGMRTVEKSYEYYMRQYRYLGTAPECQWNGPVWPYQTTQVLTGMANLLDHYNETGPVTRSTWMRLLRQYTALHFQAGRFDLEEDYDPATGKPIVGLPRSHHYFHSGYIDLIMTGLVGIRPRADDVLEVDPLLPPAGDPQTLAWFRAQDVPYHGHRVAVTWDADGSHYHRGAGLSIEIDGREVARRKSIGRLQAPISRKANPPIHREIDRAVQLVRGQYPIPSASSGEDAEKLHGAIDGRVWFYPELPNGWESDGSNAPQWFAVNFGKTVSLGSVELSFFADAARYSAPRSVSIEYWRDGRWTGLAQGQPIANGVTRLDFADVKTSRIRARMTPSKGRAIRLVELKAMDGTTAH